MRKIILAAIALAGALPALAQQTGQQQQPPAGAQGSGQAPAASQPSQAPANPSSAGGSASGTSSQQVVVNPPQGQPPPPPGGSTTVVNPPAPAPTAVVPPPHDQVVVEREPPPNPLATVALDGAYGGAAGLLVGFGVALVNQFDRWDRDLMVGAGAGVLIGAAVGVVQATIAARDERERTRERYGRADVRVRPPPSDGMNRTDQDPVITGPTVGYAWRF